MNKPTYLLYAKTGKEQQVAEELRLDHGIDVWCGRVIRWLRKGKDRRPEPYEEAALPNYLWATMTAEQFYKAQGNKFIYPTIQIVSHRAEKGLREFQRMTDEAYQRAAEIRRRAEAPPPEYNPDQPLEIIGGPFRDMVYNFRRVANPNDPLNRKVVVDGPFGEIEIDPLDVRAAG